MRPFNNYYVRYFAGGFLIGALVVSLTKATGQIKDFKVERLSDGSALSENQTWALFCALVGVCAGILGLGMGGFKKRLSKV